MTLVSIGIPTYNRAATLRRAIGSALSQSYADIEVVVADDGSNDSTEATCRELAATDGRVRYLRSPTNLGLAANHNRLFPELRGQYAMLLCDDDWLASDYVERCLARLRDSPDHVLVCGLARYTQDGRPVRESPALSFDQESAAARICAYLKAVDENGLLYGLMPRSALERLSPMRDVLGNDWLVVMELLAQGRAATTGETSIFRELGGTSADFAKLTSAFGASRWQSWVPHLVIAAHVLAEVAWRAPVYRGLPLGERLRLASCAPFSAIRWRSLAWHMTMPIFAALGRRRGGHWLWQGYLRLARSAGGAKDVD